MEEEINRVAVLLAGLSSITKEKRIALFELHNKIFKAGLSARWILKLENPNTLCGSCQRRVRQNFWKFYHFEFKGEKSSLIKFHGREGGGRIKENSTSFSPIYVKV